MLATLFAAATLASAPLQSDEMTRNVVMDVCLPFVNGETDRAALEFLGFVVASEDGSTTDFVSSDEQQRYQLRLVADSGEDDGEVARLCLLQARSAGFDAVKSAIRRPLEQAGFVLDATMPAKRPIWTHAGVTVSARQNDGRAAMVRVSYSSLEP